MRYDLDEEAVRALVAAALAGHRSGTGRFVALAVGPSAPLADVARTVERVIFEEAFGNDVATMTAEYRAYEEESLFFLILDRRTGMPAGAARVIDRGGKTLADAPGCIGVPLAAIVAAHDLRDGRIWDFATVAVLPEYRGGRSGLAVSSLLYRTFLRAGWLNDVRHIVVMLDHRAHRNMKLLGVELVALAGSQPFEYLGSPSTEALYVPFADLQPSIARQAERLGRLHGEHAGNIPGRGLRRLIIRRIAAGVSRRVASGVGLDQHIALPAADRRRVVRQP
jgi:hypothetical protein